MSYNPYGHQPYQQFAAQPAHRPGDYLKASLVASQQKEEAERKLQEMQRKANQKVKLEERKRKILLQKQRMKEQQARKAALKKSKQAGDGPPGIVMAQSPAPKPTLGQVFSSGPPEGASADTSSTTADTAATAGGGPIRTKPSRFGMSAPSSSSSSAGSTTADSRLAQALATAAALQQQTAAASASANAAAGAGGSGSGEPAKRASKWDVVDPAGPQGAADAQKAALVSAQLRAAQEVASKIATKHPPTQPAQRDEDGELIPAAPADIGTLNAIHNLVDFVAKNGVQFEEVVRAKNRDSKNFRFLFDMLTPEYLYYKYKLRRAQKKHEEAENREMVKRALNRGGGSGGYGGGGGSSGAGTGGYGSQPTPPSGGFPQSSQSGGYPTGQAATPPGGYPSGGAPPGGYPPSGGYGQPPAPGGFPPAGPGGYPQQQGGGGGSGGYPMGGGGGGGGGNTGWNQPHQQPPVSQGGFNGSAGGGGYPGAPGAAPGGGPSPTSSSSSSSTKRKKSKWDEGPSADAPAASAPSGAAPSDQQPYPKVRRGFHDGPPPEAAASSSSSSQQQQPDLDSLDEQEFSRARTPRERASFSQSYNNAPPPASLSAVPPPRSLNNGPRGRFSAGPPSSASASSGGPRQFSVVDPQSRRRSRSRSPQRDGDAPKRRRFSERQDDAGGEGDAAVGAGGEGESAADSLAQMEWFAQQADRSQQRDYIPTPEEDKPVPDSKPGGHHIGDFLPPEEAAKFEAPPPSGRQHPPTRSAKHKIGADNKGYQMLLKSGWKKGSGLGAQASGNEAHIEAHNQRWKNESVSADRGNEAPIEAHNQRWENQGVGAGQTNVVDDDEDDEFARYKKKMMTAYKYRPNPMNNPRKPYY